LLDSLTVKLGAIALSAAFLAAVPLYPAFAATIPVLGAPGAMYAVLAGPAVTLTDSTITGDVFSGMPYSTVTQTNSTVSGTVHQGDAAAIAAYTDFLTGYDLLANEPCNVTLSGTLSGQILAPNVYCFDAAATLTGQLTLDGPANGVWIFKVGTLGTGALTGTNFSVVMAGGGIPCNVYWWTAEAATMTTSNFQGTLLSGAASTFTGGSLIGRDLSKAAATLTGVTVSACGATVTPPVDPCIAANTCPDPCIAANTCPDPCIAAHTCHYCNNNDHDNNHNHDKDHEKDHDKDRDHDKEHDKDHDKDHSDHN
jgi:hypothetical protein